MIKFDKNIKYPIQNLNYSKMPRISFDTEKDLNKDFQDVLDRESENKSKVLRALMRAYIDIRNNSSKAHSEIISEMKEIE